MRLGRLPTVLVVVARENASLYSYLTEEFVRDLDLIEIVIDRRDHRESRAHSIATAERRDRDRRIRAVDDLLRTFGWALVRRRTFGEPRKNG